MSSAGVWICDGCDAFNSILDSWCRCCGLAGGWPDRPEYVCLVCGDQVEARGMCDRHEAAAVRVSGGVLISKEKLPNVVAV